MQSGRGLEPWNSYGTSGDGFLPRRKASPERHAGGQVLQVSWIEELGHVQAQFAAGFQEHVDIILQIHMTQTDEAVFEFRALLVLASLVEAV